MLQLNMDYQDALDVMSEVDKKIFHALTNGKSIVEVLMAMQLVAEALEKKCSNLPRGD